MLQQQQEQQLIHLDFNGIEKLDPCLEGGYTIIYNQEMPFLVRFIEDEQASNDKHTVELIRGTVKDFQQMTLELTSENDLFFYYFHTVDNQNFQIIKNQQQLSIEFRDYPDVCGKSFQKCHNEQQQFAPILNLQSNGRATLQILQTLEYKELELISFEMIAGDEDIIRQHVTYKYSSIKQKYTMIESKLRDVNEVVRMKNPQLLLHIQKYVKQS